MTAAPPPHVLARYDFESYCAYMQPGYIKARHTRYLCHKLDEVAAGRIKRLIVCMPPRHSKSWHISRLFPAYYLGKYPHRQVIGATHSGSLATDFGRDVRDFIEDEQSQLVFPGVRCKQDSKAANKFHVERKGSKHRGVYVTATRTGRKSGRGADLLLVDDLLDEMETYSPAAIQQAQRALRGLRTRLQKNAAIVLLMNRTGEDDPIAYALENFKHEGWEVVSFQAIAEQDERYEMPGGEVWERKAGEALWPEMFSLEALEALRTGMPIHEWSAKYQQRPIPIGAKLVDEAWFEDRRYDDDPEDILRDALRIITTEDTSKGTATGARTAIGLIAETKRGAFLLRVWAERWQMPQIIEKSKEAAVAGNPHMVLIEDKSTGESLIQLLRAEQAGAVRPQDGQVRWRWPIEPIRPVQDKVVRFAASTPAMKNGELWLPSRQNRHTRDWLPKFEAELFRYPNTDQRDQGDMISQFLNWRRENPLEGMKSLTGFGKMSEELSNAYDQDDVAAW